MSGALKSFYNQLLPAYAPQEETALAQLRPTTLGSLSFRYSFSVQAMIQISHLIEDAVREQPGENDLHVCFQYFSRFKDQEARYQQIAQAAKHMWLYGAADAELAPLPQTTLVDITGSPVVRFWYVIAYGPATMMTLLAEEHASPTGRQRVYEGIYTFESNIAYKLIRLLHGLYPDAVPEPTPLDEL